MGRTIELNENGKMVKWYGFWVSEDASEEECYIDFFSANEPNKVALCLHGETIAVVDYYALRFANIEAGKVINTENAIMDYIYRECRKHEKHRKIYVDEVDTEIISVAGDADDFMTEKERKLDDYFFEKEMQETNY